MSNSIRKTEIKYGSLDLRWKGVWVVAAVVCHLNIDLCSFEDAIVDQAEQTHIHGYNVIEGLPEPKREPRRLKFYIT